MMGKDLNANPESRRKAQKRIKECRLVFTTCIGANLGLLRGESFQIVLVDEASQQSEAMTLAPLVKGCERAVLVGDHVQLRATTGQHAQLVDFDVSLFERLYNENLPGISKVMLDTQYRMHRDICSFSSQEFYNGALATAVRDSTRPIPPSQFPWPKSIGDNQGRKVFIQCSDPEDLGRKSKCNRGQATLCREVCRLLKPPSTSQSLPDHSIIVLTPYTRQIELLRTTLEGVEVFSIDGFQGREADIIIFVTVRCNVKKEMGFLKDMRRLNVAMTRAKTGVIVIGDSATLCEGEDASNEIWGRLVKSCVRVQLEKPEVAEKSKVKGKLPTREPQSGTKGKKQPK
jgi:superfamily I DNA and/or RNA helicase